MTAIKPHRAVWIFAILHLALAIAYALATPYRMGGNLVHQGGAYAADIGAPDERQHANYVARVAQGRGIPVLDPKDPNLYENYQAHQPPVYYVLAAGVAKLTGGDKLETRAEGLPIRIFNGLIGAANVVGVFFFVLWGFRREGPALAAAAFAALLPMNVALSGAISNDPLLYALCTWTLALTAKGIRDGFSFKLAGGIGLLMGLAFLTKTTAVALAPAVAVGFAASRPSKSDVLRYGGLAFVVAMALGVPWWLRNQSAYGDPLAMSAFTAAFTGSPQAADYLKFTQGDVVDYWITGSTTGTGVAWWTLRSFFGVFGYMDIFVFKAIYALLGVLLAVLIAVRVWTSRTESDVAALPVRIMGGLFFFIVLALFLRFNSQYFQGQARYLFPALAPIAATIGLAVSAMRKRNGAKQPSSDFLPAAVMGIVLLALNVYALGQLPREFGLRTGEVVQVPELGRS